MLPWKAYLDRKPWERSETLHVHRENSEGRIEVMLPPSVKVYDRGMFVSEDDAFIRSNVETGQATEFLQAMLDLAWTEGMRPRGFADHTNELTATKYHLEDMRKLALPKE